jgi:hypothetical protein
MGVITHARLPHAKILYRVLAILTFPVSLDLGSSAFGLPVDDHFVPIYIHFILHLFQLNAIEFSLSPTFFRFFEGLNLQQIIQNSPNLIESEIIIRDDVEE